MSATGILLGLVSFLLAQGIWKSFVRARRAKARARGFEKDGDATGDGVVEGEVAYAQGEGTAMRVDVDQAGSESESSGSWSHKWTEVSRKLTVRPFYLVQERENGRRRIRVEPEEGRCQLYDSFENRILVDETGGMPRRTKTATLVPGERVWVAGRLVRGDDPEATETAATAYRENARAEGWVLRGSPTLLVSSYPLAPHFHDRAALHRGQMFFCLVLLLLPGLMVWRWFDRVEGDTVTGQVVSVAEQESCTNDDDNSNVQSCHTTGYVSTVSVAGKAWQSEEEDLEPKPGDPFTLRIGAHSSNDGASAHFTSGERTTAFFLLGFVALVRLILGVVRNRTRPWFRSKPPLVDTGSGRLGAG
jgi:hypothetical protein